MPEQRIGYNGLLKPVTLERITAEINSKTCDEDYEHALYLMEMYLCQYLQKIKNGHAVDDFMTVEKVLKLFGLTTIYSYIKGKEGLVTLDREKLTFSWFITYSLPEGRVRTVTTTVHPHNVVINTTETPRKERHRRQWRDLPPDLKKKLRQRYGYTFDN